MVYWPTSPAFITFDNGFLHQLQLYGISMVEVAKDHYSASSFHRDCVPYTCIATLCMPTAVIQGSFVTLMN